jgi:hypothetical protein
MPHRIHKGTNTLYNYVIIIFNAYASLMYELKKIGKVFTSKFVGPGPSSYKKGIYWAAVSQMLRNTAVDSRYTDWATPGPAFSLQLIKITVNVIIRTLCLKIIIVICSPC